MTKKYYPTTFVDALLLLILPFFFAFPIIIINIFISLSEEWLINFTLIFYFIGFIGTFLTVNKKRKNSISFNYKIYNIIIFLSLFIIGYQMGIHVPINFALEEVNNESLFSSLLPLISIIIFGPILEETIFRGVILKGFLLRYSPKTAILLSALLFALIHMNIIQGFGAFIFGIFTGYVYYKTKSVGMTIILHAINNLFGVLGLFLNNKYGNFQVNSITDIYGYYSIYIISFSLILFIFIFWSFCKKTYL